LEPEDQGGRVVDGGGVVLASGGEESVEDLGLGGGVDGDVTVEDVSGVGDV
jgi:hypothetical protein